MIEDISLEEFCDLLTKLVRAKKFFKENKSTFKQTLTYKEFRNLMDADEWTDSLDIMVLSNVTAQQMFSTCKNALECFDAGVEKTFK